MACVRVLCFLTDKVLKSLYTLLLIVVMVLWIVISVEAGRQLQEIHQKTNNGQTRLKPEDARRLPGSLASAAMISATKTSISRLYGLTIFNTLLEEVIALAAIVSLFLKARRLFHLTLTLLLIIWFIEQYRISDFYHQIDHLDYGSSQLIIATHVLHFLIVLIGVLLSLLESLNDSKLAGTPTPTIEEASNGGSGNKKVSARAFADLERNVSPAESENRTILSDSSREDSPDDGLVKKARCAWMRATFVKCKDGEKGGKKGRTTARDRTRSQITVIGIDPEDTRENDGEGGGGRGNYQDDDTVAMADK